MINSVTHLKALPLDLDRQDGCHVSTWAKVDHDGFRDDDILWVSNAVILSNYDSAGGCLAFAALTRLGFTCHFLDASRDERRNGWGSVRPARASPLCCACSHHDLHLRASHPLSIHLLHLSPTPTSSDYGRWG